MFEIEGKVALITGALGGIGQWYTKALLQNKVKGVVLVDVNEENADKFKMEMEETYGPGKCLFIKVDLTDSSQIEAAFEKTVKHFNQLDIVINNAGIMDEVRIERGIEVNLTATCVITNLAMNKYLPEYRKGEEGVVINTSSISAFYNIAGLPTYVAAKQGVIALGRCLGTADHYALQKVRVLTIVPGGTTTPIQKTVDQLPKTMRRMLYKLDKTQQSPECLGIALIKLLLEGKNGSVWVVKNSKPAMEIDFTVSDNSLFIQIEEM